MKKILALIAIITFSVTSYSNTIDLKTEKLEIDLEFTKQEDVQNEKLITICYEIRRTVRQVAEFLVEVTITYRFVEYPGQLGNGTVYVNSTDN